MIVCTTLDQSILDLDVIYLINMQYPQSTLTNSCHCCVVAIDMSSYNIHISPYSTPSTYSLY